MVKNVICCNNTCNVRFECVYFSKAIDYVAGKIGGEYDEIKDCRGEKYLKMR